jgi:CelD/BcsL family acetyltransferase involved in cellulose biosynthesis
MTFQSHTLTIEAITDVDKLAQIEHEWNNLLKVNQTKTVELCYDWQITHWKNFHDQASLYVLIVKDGDSIVGIAPLKRTYIRTYGIMLRSLDVIAARDSNYQDFIYPDGRADVVKALLDYVADHRHDWDILTLRNVPDSTTTVELLTRNSSHPFALRIPIVEKCLYLAVDIPWSDHVSTLPKKSRQEIANRRRRLEKQGQVRYVRCADEAQFTLYFRQFIEIHRKKWNPTPTPSMFNDECYRQFHLESALALFAQQQAELFVLELNNCPIAFLYIQVFDGVPLIQLIAYDPDYAKSAPTIVLHEYVIQQFFEDQTARLIDFGYFFDYKEMWANLIKRRLTIKAYSPTLRGQYYFVRDRWHRFAHDLGRRLTPARLAGYARKKLARVRR